MVSLNHKQLTLQEPHNLWILNERHYTSQHVLHVFEIFFFNNQFFRYVYMYIFQKTTMISENQKLHVFVFLYKYGQ